MIFYFANLIISSETVNTFPAISIQVFRPAGCSVEYAA